MQESLLNVKISNSKSFQAIVEKSSERKINLNGDTREVMEKLC